MRNVFKNMQKPICKAFHLVYLSLSKVLLSKTKVSKLIATYLYTCIHHSGEICSYRIPIENPFHLSLTNKNKNTCAFHLENSTSYHRHNRSSKQIPEVFHNLYDPPPATFLLPSLTNPALDLSPPLLLFRSLALYECRTNVELLAYETLIVKTTGALDAEVLRSATMTTERHFLLCVVKIV